MVWINVLSFFDELNKTFLNENKSKFFMKIIWTKHASERFFERALMYGLNKEELEYIIQRQEVRLFKGFDIEYNTDKFETIGVIAERYFTIEKAEDDKRIIVLTLWESKKKEIDLWKLKKE